MFFGAKAKKAEDQKILDTMLAQKEEIQKRLREMSAVNDELHATVAATQEVSLQVMQKLKNELKVAKKSVLSISKKLREGAILLDWKGEVIQVNDAAEKMFHIKEADYVKKLFRDLVSMMGFVDGTSMPTEPLFFSHLSERILQSLHCKDCGVCTTDERIKQELPNFFDLDNDVATELQLNKGGKLYKLNFSFSILDNDPERVTDITYIFLFKKKT